MIRSEVIYRRLKTEDEDAVKTLCILRNERMPRAQMLVAFVAEFEGKIIGFTSITAQAFVEPFAIDANSIGTYRGARVVETFFMLLWGSACALGLKRLDFTTADKKFVEAINKFLGVSKITDEPLYTMEI
jgi:hypothetical protein